MERPNPDELLIQVKAEEAKRGKLKIFFGAAAGVGKTYTMLESARQRKKEGIDIVVGYVETHKRIETEALLDGFEILPPKAIQYKNVELKEFDIDAALTRNPAIILVDELAHTNAPGSRHLKRWQDVDELLGKGIDVYTTLNVQHCESVNDVVAQITGIAVHETVPDTLVENAAEIELVDIPTEDLLKRLKEGKVYIGEQAERASQHFFQPGNLIALRQLALRYTAHNVDAKLVSFKQAHVTSRVWNVQDKFLVCISTSPKAINLIRAGKRIASDLGADWTVAYVETPSEMRIDDKNRVSEMMRFAEKLGARTVTLSGQEIADTLISYARSKNITKIIMGKPERVTLHEMIFGSIVNKLAHKSGEIDLYLLSGDIPEQPVKFRQMAIPPFSWNNLWGTIGIVGVCSLIDWLLFPHFGTANLLMIYLLGITWIAFRYGRRMSIIASFLSVLCFDFLFVTPYFSFAIADLQYLVTFAGMLVVGFTIAYLTGRLRRQTSAMQLREDRTQTLYALSRDLAKSSYPDELFRILLRHVQEFFKCPVVILTPDATNKLAANFGETKEIQLTSKELSVAQWAYENKKAAGRGTDTLPSSTGIYLPFIGMEKTVGVIGIFQCAESIVSDPEQFHILEMFISQTALAVEGAQLAVEAIEADTKVENERFRNMMLTSFSFDLTEPLASIVQTVDELLKTENINNSSVRNALAEKIRREATLLNGLLAQLPEIAESKKSK